MQQGESMHRVLGGCEALEDAVRDRDIGLACIAGERMLGALLVLISLVPLGAGGVLS